MSLRWRASFSREEKKVKVSRGQIAVGAGSGVRVPLYLGHSKRKAEPIHLLVLPHPSLIQKGTHLLLG